MNPNSPQNPNTGTTNVPTPEPVAYDKDGRPLYAQPLQPQVVHMARPHDPVQQEIPEEIKQKHEESKKQYPELNLSDGEYVISAVKRHPIGILSIWSVVGLIVLLILIGLPAIASSGGVISSVFGSGEAGAQVLGLAAVVLIILCGLFIVGGMIATAVYKANKFFLTNESVTQFLQTSLFSKKEQTISLANIEDASFTQRGLLQHLLNYGSLRLSTEGDETTYRFNYVTDPKVQVTKLNNAVEAFKNGRPFNTD